MSSYDDRDRDRDRGRDRSEDRHNSRMNRSNNNECRLYVGNLPERVDSRDLEDLFHKYGSIVGVELKLPKGRGTPYAFVEFDDSRLVIFANETMTVETGLIMLYCLHFVVLF